MFQFQHCKSACTKSSKYFSVWYDTTGASAQGAAYAKPQQFLPKHNAICQLTNTDFVPAGPFEKSLSQQLRHFKRKFNIHATNPAVIHVQIMISGWVTSNPLAANIPLRIPEKRLGCLGSPVRQKTPMKLEA